MYKVTVIGHFGEGLSSSDGQTIKTKTVTEGLEEYYGSERVCKVDTHGGIKTLLKAPFILKKAFTASDNVVILPAENGLRVFAPLCALWKRKHPGVKLHYMVIGGWLPSFVGKHRYLLGYLKDFDTIFVETSGMEKALAAMGFDNLAVMPNCKELNILKPEELTCSTREPFKLCTFSRVMKEKGIEDAVQAVTAVNTQYGREVYNLDIYGGVDSAQTEWFANLKETFPPYVRYMGVAPYDRSVHILKDYFALLFPTRFYTEGIPGTVIDGFAAGVPVISAKWENFGDMITEGATGLGYAFNDADGLKNALCLTAEHPEQLLSMKTNCLTEAEKYTPREVIRKACEHFA